MLIPTNAPAPYAQILLLAERDPATAVEQAQQLRQQLASVSVPIRAWAHFTVGWTLLRRFELPQILAHLQQARAAFQALGAPEMVLHCRRALLMAELVGCELPDDEGDWDTLAADYRSLGLDLDAARAQIHKIGYLNVIGLPQAALALSQEIEPFLQAHGTADDQARWLRVTAVAAKQAGLLHQAAAQLEQAAARFRDLDYPVEVAKCLLEQAHVAERQGAFPQASEHLTTALALFHDLRLPFQVAVCEKNIGIVASWLGQLDRALTMTLKARTTFSECGQRGQAASCDLSLGNISLYSGLFDLALAAYQRAETAYAALGFQRQTLIARRNQTLVFQEQGHFSAAYEALCVLEGEVAALGDELELAEVYQAQAQALRSLQRYDDALERLDHAEKQLERLGRQVGVAECWLERGQIHLILGDAHTAERWFEAARATLHDEPIYAWRVLHGLGRCAEARGAITSALAHYESASSTIARLRHRLVNEHASSALFALARSVYEDAIRLAAATQQVSLVLKLAEEQRALVLHQRLNMGQLHIPAPLADRYAQQQQHVRALMATPAQAPQIDAALTEYAELLLQLIHNAPLPERLIPEPPPIEHLRARCDRVFPQGWVMLHYVEYSGELLIMMIDGETLTLTSRPCDLRLTRLLDQASLTRLRPSTFNDLPQLRDPARRAWQALDELADLLLPAALYTRLQPDLRLIIVPSERLHSLPWATLRVGDAWLCEQAILHIAPSLALWEPATTHRLSGNDALLVGCSEFGDRAVSLPGIAAELDVVAEIYPGQVTRLYNQQTTRSRLLQMSSQHQLRQYALVHIASHAQLTGAQGLLAHVMLWDEDLLYDEIARLALDGALVVLSTCDGAANEVLPGDEVMSLSRAFLSAGARDVIANLWSSYDGAAPELMRLLYTQLAEGYDPAQAVARMQRMLLARGEERVEEGVTYASPLVWGGFHVVGSSLTALGSASGTPR